jgi:hypothetical protein
MGDGVVEWMIWSFKNKRNLGKDFEKLEAWTYFWYLKFWNEIKQREGGCGNDVQGINYTVVWLL